MNETYSGTLSMLPQLGSNSRNFGEFQIQPSYFHNEIFPLESKTFPSNRFKNCSEVVSQKSLGMEIGSQHSRSENASAKYRAKPNANNLTSNIVLRHSDQHALN
ncbi:hypothetical protein M758_1G022800 [Ceratodon purpureus]|nr:hypothetical protein M758_1G022800 [Ceratodon purpureus]